MDIFVTLLNTQEETSLLNAQEETTRIQRRIIKDRQNPMEEWSGEEFRVRYRFSKGNVVDLLNIISGDLSFATARNNPIPPLFRLLAALRFYATGQFQRSDGDLLQFHQTTMSRIVKQVSIAIASRKSIFMKFPTTTTEKWQYRKHSIPLPEVDNTDSFNDGLSSAIGSSRRLEIIRHHFS